MQFRLTLTVHRLCLVALIGCAAWASLQASQSLAQETGTISIQQESVSGGALGSWTLIRPGNNKLQLDRKTSYETDTAIPGLYSLLIDQPKGASTEINVYKNGALVTTEDHPQTAFTLAAGDHFFVQIIYTLTRTGTVSVTSDPAGVRFVIQGPNDWKTSGETPQSFPDSPEGLYSVEFRPVEGCFTGSTQSDRLVESSRVDFSIVLACEGMEEMFDEEYQKKLEYVTVMTNGGPVIYEDVPIDAWFAPFVHTAVRTGIMSGYKGDDGQPLGQYGPGDNVTIAQLAKIAHEIADIDVHRVRGTPKNPRVQGTWFEQYYLSAEQRKWLVFRDARQDPGRPATRGEVVATALQALDIPRVWPKGELFRDVDPDTPYASSIETAAADAIITGTIDVADKSPIFRPNDPINRAEIAKMLSLAIDIYLSNSPEIQPDALDN